MLSARFEKPAEKFIEKLKDEILLKRIISKIEKLKAEIEQLKHEIQGLKKS